MPYDNYIHETTPYKELLDYVNSVLDKTPGEKESFEKKAHEILVSLWKEAEENLRADHTKVQIREFYERKFSNLQEQLRNQPKQLLTSYCESRCLPCSSDEELLSSLDGNSWGNFSREEWKDVLNGDIKRDDYFKVPLSLGMGVQEAKDFITKTSNLGFDYNDGANLLFLFAFSLNDAKHPLTEKEFEQLCKYYKGLSADNSPGAVMNYDELFATPDAESNTIVNKDSVASRFKEIANQYGKEEAIRAMESFLKRRYTRLNGLSLRATTLFQKLVECTVPLTTDGNQETDFLNGQRRLPYADIDAEVASKSIKRASLLYTRPYNLTDADKDLASKKNVHLSQYFHIDANGKIQRETTQSFYLLLRGETKPTKADILAALYRACTTNWLNKCKDDKELVRQHVIEFCKLATAILKAAMLPPFVVENPLEQCYLLAVVAFHEGYVLFYTQRSDNGEPHEHALNDVEKKLNDSRIAKKFYSDEVCDCFYANDEIRNVCLQFVANFRERATEAKGKDFDCIFGNNGEGIYSKEFITELTQDKAFQPLVEEITRYSLSEDSCEKIIRKHVSWMILNWFLERLSSEASQDVRHILHNVKPSIYTKRTIKISFKH